jgi:stage V sporulation protein S
VSTVTQDREENLIRVSATTPPQAVANSIFKAIFEQQTMPVIRAIGAGAVCQTVKGIAIARGLTATRGRDLATTVGFDTIKGDSGNDISAQTFYLFLR